MPLNNLLYGLIETGFNQLHQLDSTTNNKRKQLNGTIIGVSLKEINLPLFFVISSQQVDILGEFEGATDCFIRVNISALTKLQDNSQLTHLIKTEQLEVEGDIQLVQQFAALLTDMNIDWEEHLSQKIGDVAAHKFCYQLKQLHLGITQQFSKIEKQTSLFLTEELKMAPSPLEVAYFCDKVKTVETETDALLKKLDKHLDEM